MSMLVGKPEDLDNCCFPTNKLCDRALQISFPGKRFTQIEFHDGLDVRQNQEDLEDSQLDSILKEVFGIRLENPLGIREIIEGNKVTGAKEKLEKLPKNTMKNEDTPDNEKLTKEKELEKAKIKEMKEKKKREQDERAKKGEKEKKVDETETAM